MKTSKAIMSTILGLSGVLIGAYLITKLTRGTGEEKFLGKKDGGGEIEEKKEQKITNFDINERQNKIMVLLSKEGSLTVRDLTKSFPKISTRTLRRDMDMLVSLKVASQEGSTKSTYYKYLLK